MTGLAVVDALSVPHRANYSFGTFGDFELAFEFKLTPGANSGVNVISDGVSSWSICSEETYAHEVGHNLGAEHQQGAQQEKA